MKKNNIIFFLLGTIAGIMGFFTARKVQNYKVLNLPENWFEGDDMQHWS
ncbi:MAG: hypothetical protein IJ218_04280 [Alphaproteobacteria bacterium]|nr:hypothetical protein [Alphaproteobacteria bacterium]